MLATLFVIVYTLLYIFTASVIDISLIRTRYDRFAAIYDARKVS